jgi:DNA adenine methylase
MRIEVASNRPALRLYGAQWNNAPHIVPYIPEMKQQHYVEGMGGTLSVLLSKPRSYLETTFDVNGWYTNYFQVLRDRPDDLVRAIWLTPWSRIEYERHRLYLDSPPDDPVEKARILWVGQIQSIGAMAFSKSGWRHTTGQKPGKKPPGKPASRTEVQLEHLYVISRRLQGVQIECRDFFEEFPKYDGETTLFYLDPPYLSKGTQRTSGGFYLHDWTADDHVRLARLLRGMRGRAIISGYASELYRELYEDHGWNRVSWKTTGNAGVGRTESIWLSPGIPVDVQIQLPMEEEVCVQ